MLSGMRIGIRKTNGRGTINILMRTFRQHITETEKLKPKKRKLKFPADYEQAAKDQVYPASAAYSGTFVESMEYSHHQISGKEAFDKKLINNSQLKTIHKHVGNYLGDYHSQGEPKFSFHKGQLAVHHIHIDNKNYHIQIAVSKHGKHYHHTVFAKTPDASMQGGTRFTKVKQVGFDHDN